jgi:hypothetical protein
VQATLINFQRVLGLVDPETAIAMGGSGQSINFGRSIVNSVIVSILVVAGQTSFSAMAAYAFARLRFPFRDGLFAIYIAALMVPGIVTTIPNFILIRQLGWLNTFAGIVAPAFLMTPFAVFFLRQFFLGVNREVEEAARIDGASIWGLFHPGGRADDDPGADHAGDRDADRHVEQLPMAADRGQRRERTRADGGAWHLPHTDAARLARLDGVDGRHDAGDHPDLYHFHAVGAQNSGFDPVHRLQIIAWVSPFAWLPGSPASASAGFPGRPQTLVGVDPGWRRLARLASRLRHSGCLDTLSFGFCFPFFTIGGKV